MARLSLGGPSRNKALLTSATRRHEHNIYSYTQNLTISFFMFIIVVIGLGLSLSVFFLQSGPAGPALAGKCLRPSR
jgi:hypothetical protein